MGRRYTLCNRRLAIASLRRRQQRLSRRRIRSQCCANIQCDLCRRRHQLCDRRMQRLELGNHVRTLLALLLLTTPALAQQLSPSQIAIAVDQAVNQLAQSLEQLQKENAELKRQLQEAQQEKK